ncbi:UDP-N-acetylglucosamine transporter TMEM241 isoform X4 [Petaurus breviceps papuanus]|uniref:UDP-N-acetylglucosamine transporter TMEM241 isoform X4 n=1 Tax=Petaurus breviceps papuanus TaxID=3040969 RepID=UPI0036DC4287
MLAKRPFPGLTFCAFYLATYLTNKVADINWWTFASHFLEAGLGGDQQQFQLTSPAKIWSAVFLLVATGCLPFYDSQFDPVGYFWATIHLFCVGFYKILHKVQKSNVLSDIDQQYLNYIFSMVLLTFASHPTGDLFRALEFPFLYFYRFHTSCCASGFLGFFLMLSSVKLKNNVAPAQHTAWIFFAKVMTAGFSVLLFDTVLDIPTVACLLLGGLGEALLVYSEKTNT